MRSARVLPSDRRSDGYLTSRAYARGVFAMTFLLMVFDFMDRQIIVSMFPYMKAEWALSDRQLGALVSVVSITVALGTFPVALIADRWSRVKSITIMASVWSVATMACGFTRSFAQLFAARSLIGLGEAGYGPAGGALLAALFPSRLRGTVMGAFLAAGSLGSVLGVVLGGVIAARYGWRAGFGIVGIPGLVVALLFLLLRDYETVALRPEGPGSVGGGLQTWSRDLAAGLFRARSGVAACVGGALQLLVVSTVYSWLPSFLNRAYGLPGPSAGMQAAVVVLLGSVGAVVWGHVADRLSREDPRRRLFLPAACALLTWATLAGAFGYLAPGRLQFALISLGGFVMTATVGPVAAVVIDVVHPGLRATAGAMVALVQNLFGLAAGPLIAGVLSDAHGLEFALAVIPLSCLLAAASFFVGARTYESDRVHAAALLVTEHSRGTSARNAAGRASDNASSRTPISTGG
jgi:MFS family permease